MLPETMSLIEETLGWEPGTIRGLVLDLRPVDDSPEAALRRRLIAYLAGFRVDELTKLIAFIESDMTHRTIGEQADMANLRSVVEANSAGIAELRLLLRDLAAAQPPPKKRKTSSGSDST